MGLDMYLSRKTYIGNKWRPKERKITIRYPKGDDTETFKVAKGEINEDKISYIEEEAAYWRKANHIHQWFVDEVQGGVDECQTSYVSMENLEDLVDRCKQVLLTVKTDKPFPKTAEENYDEWEKVKILDIGEADNILPTSEGFFFGSTEYGIDYFYDIQLTIDQLEPFLEKDSEGKYINNGEFYYHSSW